MWREFLRAFDISLDKKDDKDVIGNAQLIATQIAQLHKEFRQRTPYLDPGTGPESIIAPLTQQNSS